MISNADPDLSAARPQRLRQWNLHTRVRYYVIHFAVRGLSVHLDRVQEEAVGKLWLFASVSGARPSILAIGVLVELQPKACERIGTVVGVGDYLVRAQLLAGRVEVGMDLVVRAVLPVIRTRCAVTGP